MAKEKLDDLDEVLEAGEVLLDQIERDVVRELELEQEFSHLMEEEGDQVVKILQQLSLSTKTRFEIADKRATRTSCVQLSPPLSGRAQHSTHKVANLSHIFREKKRTFPSTGNWMYVVNMPDDTQYQQFVRSEVCM